MCEGVRTCTLKIRLLLLPNDYCMLHVYIGLYTVVYCIYGLYTGLFIGLYTIEYSIFLLAGSGVFHGLWWSRGDTHLNPCPSA